MAERHREHFFIGMDACRENLRANSQRRLPNALFVIARAQALPRELNGLADRITIHFPWGSLLESLLNGDTSLLAGFDAVTRPHAGMEIHLNADAVTAAGWELQAGAEQVERVLNSAAWTTRSHSCLNARDLRDVPTTWAKRLAFGRDPRAIRLSLQKG
jgi:16S rRNA (adenine(1408)-N(1))-methyltransferase